MESFLRKKFKLHKKHMSAGPSKTGSLGASFAKLLVPGDTAGLLGGLGAGKTHFIKGAASSFGFKPRDIVSPTFNLVKEHKKQDLLLYHFDLYRLINSDELDKIGYRDYITAETAVTFIEWPDRIKETWKDYTWIVEIRHKGGNKREIRIYKPKVQKQESGARRKPKTRSSKSGTKNRKRKTL